MDKEQISFWVRLVLTLVSLLLSKGGQVQLASSLFDKHSTDLSA